MSQPDPFDLQRFVDAQNSVYERVCSELRGGCKTSHWMWFVFPQLRGLGQSAMSTRYAISSQAEAEAYLEHPVLGPRLRECVEHVNAVEGRTASDIFGYPDDVKFQSCLSLFAGATPDNNVFTKALGKYYPEK